MATADASVMFNPLDPAYVADPYPHLGEVREATPVQKTIAGPWALFRYDDVFRLLRDPSLSVDDANADHEVSERNEIFDALVAEFGDDVGPRADTSILNSDPPDHTRLRKLVSKAFTPRVIEGMRPRIQQLVDEALEAMATSGQPDLVDDLAFPLPFDVITEMLGMPEGDTLALRGWSEAMVKTLDPIISEDEARAAFIAARKMDAHVDEVIAWKRENPADDLLTALIDAEEDGDRLSAMELRDQVSLLFIAGHETTVNLIGTGTYELLRNPEALEQLRDDPAIARNAVEELLRIVAPVQFSRRVATADLHYGDEEIPKGSFVLACLASANRDPRHFGDDADDLRLDRPEAGQHLSFGSGVHYCLGASLAKLEAEIAIGSFVRRFPNATIDADVTWNGRLNLRGLKHLPLSLS